MKNFSLAIRSVESEEILASFSIGTKWQVPVLVRNIKVGKVLCFPELGQLHGMN